jgi:hypothetical protein
MFQGEALGWTFFALVHTAQPTDVKPWSTGKNSGPTDHPFVNFPTKYRQIPADNSMAQRDSFINVSPNMLTSDWTPQILCENIVYKLELDINIIAQKQRRGDNIVSQSEARFERKRNFGLSAKYASNFE